MKIIDFGKNAYQFNIFLKFPWISGENVTEIIQQLVGERKIFRSVLKTDVQSPLTFSVGEGTEAAPLLQLKVASDSLSIFSGWFVSYDDWMRKRDLLLPTLAQILRGIPSELVLSLFTQCSSPVPTERLRQQSEIPELKYALELFQRFLPAEARARGNAYLAFSDAENKRSVEWWLGGWGATVPIPGYENVLFSTRLNMIEVGTDLKKSLEAHAAWSDAVLEKFHANYLSLIVKG